MAYNQDSIRILEGLEAVRTRPGMYIGSTDTRGLHHLVWEILDNSIDEALNGYGSEITITLHKDGSVSVEDNGRGMPVGMHSSGVSALEVIFTVLHAGGKFDGNSYKSSGGLHGVGASVVNALSSRCVAVVHDGTTKWGMEFSEGGSKVSELKNLGPTDHTGSTVRFLPDPLIFKDRHYSFSKICERAKNSACLLNNLKITVKDLRKEEPRIEVYHYQDGLKEYVEEVNKDKNPIHDPISFKGEYNGITVAGCFQYTDDYGENITSFTNMVRTSDGGTHETGAKQAFTKAFNDYIKKNNSKSNGYEGSDIREGLTLIINLTIPENILQFESQTKSKLGTPSAKPATESVISEKLKYFLNENHALAETLTAKIGKAANARQAARKARDEARKGKNKKAAEKLISGKLVKANSKDPKYKEIFLVEGDSAGGSAKQGRDPKWQAVLPLRGKTLNCCVSSLEAVNKNLEIQTLINVLGCGFGNNIVDPETCEYHRVMIMTDSDDDGSHIQMLLLSFFYTYMRPLIEAGYIYITQSPLYKISKGNKCDYCLDDTELDIKKKEYSSGYVIQRFKGLGEMNPIELQRTTMQPGTRCLKRVTVEDALIADKRFKQLMGDNPQLRRDWIEDNINFEVKDDFDISLSKR